MRVKRALRRIRFWERQAMTTVHLPFPPSVNGLYANVPGKGRVKSQSYRIWANAAGWSIKAQRPRPIPIGPYLITVMVQRKRDGRRRDLENFIKAVSDLLVEHKIIPDDHHEERIEMQWSDAVTGCVVELVPLGQKERAA